jgi:YD repeat-containing protein
MASEEPDDRPTTYCYDSTRPVTGPVVPWVGQEPDHCPTAYHYDAVGRLVATTDAADNVTTVIYDGASPPLRRPGKNGHSGGALD